MSRFVVFEADSPLAENGPRLWVLDHGYHSGLAFSRFDLETFASTKGADLLNTYPNADWFEIGWGERGFYFDVASLEDVNFAIGAKALLMPSESVMHVATGYGWIDEVFSKSDKVSVRLSPQSFNRLIEAMTKQLDLSVALRESLYGDGHFYQGVGTYHLFNTCNSWVGQMLRASGLAVSPGMALTSKSLMFELAWRYGSN